MSDKKYLVTQAELLDFMEGFGNLMLRKLGIDDAVKAQNPRIDDEWLEAHEYTERTCHKRTHGEPTEHQQCFSCSECCSGWHESIYDKPYSYCPHCGAKVVERA